MPQVVLGTRAKTNLDYDVSELPDPFVVPPPPTVIQKVYSDESMVCDCNIKLTPFSTKMPYVPIPQ